MRFLFIRHGEPDYDNDCLTPIGKLQAQAAAKRLKDENISEIYSSPYGRAVETAEAAAKELGLKVNVLDFMHEVTWGGDVPEDGHPWTLSDKMLYEDNFDFYHKDWREHPYFKNNTILPCYDEIAKSIDDLLLTQGYRHEGIRYFCTKENHKTIALFSHGGSGGAALSHLLSLPFPYFLCVFPYTYTSIISLDFPSYPNHYIHTQMELFNDSAHIKGLNDKLMLQQVKDKDL